MGFEKEQQPKLSQRNIFAEVKTNKTWVDSKAIYRQAFDIEGASDDDELLPAGYAETLVAAYGVGDYSGTEKRAIPFDDGTSFVNADVVIADGQVRLALGAQAQTAGSTIVLEYTKA